ncbi:MAG: 4Fe-4S ferredoxin [Spirochaeta sp.]|nr:4Fe-4S ferredoxin [Spirochaeta sp.]
MECGIIKKTDLDKLINYATEQNKLFYGPAKGEEGFEFRVVTSYEEITLDYDNVKLSPKSIFFPQREVLYRFSGDTLKKVKIEAENPIIFGIRPCDASALVYLDKVFNDVNSKFQDPYYQMRREKALIIALACDTPRAACFCTSVGGSPDGKTGSDILVTDLGETLVFEPCSEKGKDFMDESGLFKKATERDIEEKEEKTRQAEQSMAKIPTPDIAALTEKIDQDFENPLWDEITQNCLGCGACTYLCPTCHCFDITDEENGKKEGIRLRTWDSCQYPLFTLHASGHNPRVNKKQRLRQRIMHKFSYSVANTGDIYCVGCGRCITNCPVNLDIRDMLNALNKL